MMRHIIPEGTSEPQDFGLRDNGVAIDGTGLDVALEIFRKVAGVMTPVSSPPTVAWLSQAAGTVRVSGVESLTVDTYYVRYRLTDGGGNDGYAPNEEKADVWRVVPVPGT